MGEIKIGDIAPRFVATDQDGKEVKLENYRGKRVILFFYPKASTPGCTAEACNLRDNYSLLQEQGYAIIGVSADSSKRQQNFSVKNNLPFSLIVDEEKKVIDAFGVWGEKKMYGRVYEGIYRTTFVIDERGVIILVLKKVKTKAHAEQILEEMQKLK